MGCTEEDFEEKRFDPQFVFKNAVSEPEVLDEQWMLKDATNGTVKYVLEVQLTIPVVQLHD